MPTFGEFETFGNPYAASDVRSHVSTIWQARKSGAAGEQLYAIKCYAPRRRAPSPNQPDEALAHDQCLEFLEGIKQIKKAQSEGGRGLTPIHALGTTPTEAWYVTDFYSRKDLNAWIDRKGEVNGAVLRHVVYSVVTTCLALKRSRGCSHGNLKPSNIFLAGKPRDLRQTPLLLSDAYPAAPLQLSRLQPDDRNEAGELLNQVMEVQDLAAIGKLVLQLVEGRLLTRADDYNYPVARSGEWDALGKDSGYWLEWCNKLLNPQLSLETLNLETLAREFGPRKLGPWDPGNLRPILAGAGVILLLVGVGAFLLHRNTTRSSKDIPFNQVPVAENQALEVTAGKQNTITLRGNDPKGAKLSYIVVARPKQGTLSGTPPTLTYTAGRAATGGDAFSFKVNNGRRDSAAATVSITISESPPVAENQAVGVTAGEAKPIMLKGNDPKGMKLSYTVVVQPKQGRLSGVPPALTYTAERTASGSDSFTFKVNNGRKDSAPATVSITISEPPPIAENQAVEVTAGEAKPITLKGNDPKGAKLSYSVVAQPKLGKLIGTPPALTYTAGRTITESDSFTFKVNNGRKDSAPATVNITTGEPPPIAENQAVEVTAGEAKPIALRGNDPKGAKLSYTVVVQPKQGRLSGVPPALTYTAERTASGSDSFTFNVNNSRKDSAPATVSITISEPPPVAENQAVEVTAGESKPITLGGNDPRGAKLNYTVAAQPKQGTLIGTPPTLTYTAWRTATGSDDFSFKVNNGKKDSAPATVSITISEPPPVAENQAVEVTAGEPKPITLKGNDPKGAKLSYSVVAQPKQGALSVAPPGLTYTAERTATGSDSFTFKVNNGRKDSAPATVSITISEPPPIADNQAVEVTAGEPKRITLNGSDPKGAKLSYQVVQNPKQGTLSGTESALTYTANLTASGSDSFRFKVSNGTKDSAPATVNITIHEYQPPPLATGQTVEVTAGEAKPITLRGSDSKGAKLSYQVVQNPKKGRLTGIPPQLTYTADQTASGSDSFNFKVNDGQKDSEKAASVTIEIAKFNQPPVATPQTVVVTAGEAKTITLGGNDPEGAKLSYSVVQNPTKGTLSGTAPVLTYSTDQTASGNDSFTFNVNDGQKDSEKAATVSIGIQNEFKQHLDNAHGHLAEGGLAAAKTEAQKALDLRPTEPAAKELMTEIMNRLNLRALDLQLINLMRQLRVRPSGTQLQVKDGTATPLPDTALDNSVWDDLEKSANKVKSGYGAPLDAERQKNLKKVFDAISAGRFR
jgi:hypothetical protein